MAGAQAGRRAEVMHSSSGRRLAILAAGTSMLVAILALARISPWIADRAGLGLAILSLLTGVACALSLPGRWRSALAGVLVVASVLALLWPSTWLLFAAVLSLAWLLAALCMAMLVWRRGARAPVHVAGGAAMALAGGSVALIVSALPALLTPALPNLSASAEAQLRHLAATDQADRRGAAMLLDGSRDRRRLARVLELDATGDIREPRAAADAALVLLHGRCPEHFQRAAQLFAMAASADVDGADEGHRASTDRYLLSVGLPQQYGTQSMQSGDAAC
jgi:hypothetical protein